MSKKIWEVQDKQELLYWTVFILSREMSMTSGVLLTSRQMLLNWNRHWFNLRTWRTDLKGSGKNTSQRFSMAWKCVCLKGKWARFVHYSLSLFCTSIDLSNFSQILDPVIQEVHALAKLIVLCSWARLLLSLHVNLWRDCIDIIVWYLWLLARQNNLTILN